MIAKELVKMLHGIITENRVRADYSVRFRDPPFSLLCRKGHKTYKVTTRIMLDTDKWVDAYHNVFVLVNDDEMEMFIYQVSSCRIPANKP